MIADRFRKRRILLPHPDGPARLSALLLARRSPSPASSSCGTSTRSPSSRASRPPSTTRPASPSSPRWSPERPAHQRRRPQQRLVQRSAGSSARRVAGLVIAAFGTGPALLLNALTFVFVLVALLRHAHHEPATPAPRARGKGQIREGLRYVRSRPDLMLVMALVFVLGTFGMNFQITTALMATKVFDKGAERVRPARLDHGHRLADRRPALGAPGKVPRLRVLLVALAGFTVADRARRAGADLRGVRARPGARPAWPR